MVRAAGDSNRQHPTAKRALSDLCEQYWYPLYAYLRKQGQSPEQAQDLTQAFFAHVLEHQAISKACREHGRFRSFLLTSLKNFVINQQEKSRAKKRGGGRPILSFDAQDYEQRYAQEPFHTLTPDKLFDRGWAVTILAAALQRLRQECAAKGQSQLLERLSGSLTGQDQIDSYAHIAADLRKSESAVKVAVHRLRRQYGQILREEVAQTLLKREDIEDEMRSLWSALRP